MSFLDADLHPTDRQIRQFVTLCLIALPLFGWYWGKEDPLVIGVCTAVGILLFAVGFRFPAIVKPLYIALLLVALPVGIIVGELVGLLIFCGVFVPIGLFFRFTGRDPLQRRLDRRAASYWQPKAEPASVERYYRQS